MSSLALMTFGPILPAILPLATFLWIRASDYSVSISRNNWYQEYDYIIVGGGSAGAVLASRLSEVPNWNVLLLEAGSSESILSDIPLAAATLQMTPIDWAYQTEPQEASCFGLINRRSRWPRGRVLGGSSVLNYMLYIRGNARDYDRWDQVFGAFGWSWADVFPYFLKSEDNRDPPIASNGYHATGGYLTVSSPPDVTPIGTTFVEAGKFIGYPNVDLNGPLQSGFAVPQGTIRRGARCSTSKAFLRPARSRPNLHVLTFSYATRILFAANKRAVGVQFERFGLSHSVYARREIIISGGSINTPQLLMLSGVGPAEHLQSLGIPLVANLPVGNNLQDHIYPGVHFSIEPKVSLIQRRVVTLPNVLRYFAAGRGPLTALGGVEGLSFIKTRYTNMSDDWPDFQIHLLSGGPTSDDGQTFRRVQGITRELWEQYYRPYLPYDTYSLYPVLLRPKSRGYVRLRSRNPYDPPIIDPKYLTHPDDIMAMVDAMKICIAVGLTPAYRSMGSRLFETVVPGCEIYRVWSDEYLACMARTYTSTIYHPVGTARMGPTWDPRSVVDPQLRVLGGISGLRIADGSVMPHIVSGNTNAPIIMIAERLADMLKGRRLPRFRPPMAGNYGLFNTRRSDESANSTNADRRSATDAQLPIIKTDFEYVDRVMRSLQQSVHRSPNPFGPLNTRRALNIPTKSESTSPAAVTSSLATDAKRPSPTKRRLRQLSSSISSNLNSNYRRLLRKLSSGGDATTPAEQWHRPIDRPITEPLDLAKLLPQPEVFSNLGQPIAGLSSEQQNSFVQALGQLRQVAMHTPDLQTNINSLLGSQQFMRLTSYLQTQMANQTYTAAENRQMLQDLMSLIRQNSTRTL